MIYITKESNTYEECSYINRVWYSEQEDLQKKYADSVSKEASARGISINRYWLNIMNRKDHNNHLTEEEYRKEKKLWKKFLRDNSFESYLRETGLAVECDYQEVY